MKKTIFVITLSLFSISIFLTACDSGSSGESVSDNQSEADQDTVIVQNGDTEAVASEIDLILLAFMNNRMQHLMAELAEEKAQSEAVKEYANSVLSGSNETRQKIEDIAQAIDTELPGAVGATQRAKVDSINQLSGEQFEQAYLSEAVLQYEENIDRLNELIRKGGNPIIEGSASEIVDTEQRHLDRAAEVLEEIS